MVENKKVSTGLSPKEDKPIYIKPAISIFEIILEQGIAECSPNDPDCQVPVDPNPGGGGWDDGGGGEDGGDL